MSEKIVQLNEEVIKGQIKELVRGSVEETLNELLETEEERLTQAARYERSEARQGYRSGHYDRNLTTTSGDVTLHVPRLKGVSFETAIIERYRRRESSVEEALIEPFPKKRTQNAEKKWNDSDTRIMRRGYIAWPRSVPERASPRRNVGVPCCRKPPNRRTRRFEPQPSWKISFFLVLPRCNTDCTNVFLRELSKEFQDDVILLCCDGAAWHKSKALVVPDNIVLFFIPPYTPDMNPIEQIWKELRKRGFRNEVFSNLEKVVDRLCDAVCSLTPAVIHSITGREWIIKCFDR